MQSAFGWQYSYPLCGYVCQASEALPVADIPHGEEYYIHCLLVVVAI